MRIVGRCVKRAKTRFKIQKTRNYQYLFWNPQFHATLMKTSEVKIRQLIIYRWWRQKHRNCRAACRGLHTLHNVNPYWFTAGLKSTVLSAVPGPMSSSNKEVSLPQTLFIFPNDVHYYKNHRMLKQFKITTLAPTCFRSRRNHHQGAVLCLAKTAKYTIPLCSFS